MKKAFIKPSLHRIELRFNENIAASWHYYYDKGTITGEWSFYNLGGPNTTTGCYELLTNNPAWPTSAYAGPNHPTWMTDWLLHDHIIAALDNDDSSDDIYANTCYTAGNIPAQPDQ